MTKLSALVVAHNEEKQLAACLDRLTFAHEIVVVLDKCTDGTKDIADQYGAKTVEGAWHIEGHRRNTGLDACEGNWILEVDADERVTPELAEEIKTTIEQYDDGYFLVPFDNFIGERRVRYGWGCSWGVSAAPRLSATRCQKMGRATHPPFPGHSRGLNANCPIGSTIMWIGTSPTC